MPIRSLFHLVIFIVLGLVIYSGVIDAPFVFDDAFYIVENPQVWDLSNFLDFSGTRYVGLLSFALNYAVGALDVTGYNLTNIAIHIVNAFLVYLMLLSLGRTPQMKGLLESAPAMPLMVGLIFLTHPVESQAVCYVTQRFASLATLFYLLSIVFYIRYRLAERDGDGLGLAKVFFYVISLVTCIIAQKTKEISFTLPAIIVLCEFTFFSFDKRALVSRLKTLLPFLLTFLVIPLTLFLSASSDSIGLGEISAGGVGEGSAISGAASALKDYQFKDLLELSPYEYFSTQLRVIMTYLRLLVLPVGQNMLYDYPKYTSVFAIPALLSLVFLAICLVALIIVFVRSRGGKSPIGMLASFGGLWFFITLSIESSVIPIKHVIFEHRLYLPSIGAILFFSALVSFLVRKLPVGLVQKPQSIPLVITIVITIILSIATYSRSLVWTDDLTLWGDVVSKSPGLSTAQNNYAKAVEKAGDKALAMKHYQEAVRLSPNFAAAHNNIGRLYYSDGDTVMAVMHYNLALSINPALAEAHNNIANLYMKRGDNDAAIFHFNEALRFKPASSDILFGIARYYQNSGELDKAIDNYKRAIDFSPWHFISHFALAVLYQEMKNNEKAIFHYKESIAYKPDYQLAHYNIAAVYIDEKDLGSAIIHYKECIKIDPDNHDYYFNLAWTYQSAGMSDEAIAEYRKAINADPNIRETHYNLGLAYRSRNKIEKAMDAFREALRVDPGYGDARRAIKNDVWGDETSTPQRQEDILED